MYKDDASKLVLVSLKDDNSILYIFHLILATDVDPNYEVLSFKRSYFNFRVTIFWKDAITHTVPSSFKRYYPIFWSMIFKRDYTPEYSFGRCCPLRFLMYHWLLESLRLVNALILLISNTNKIYVWRNNSKFPMSARNPTPCSFHCAPAQRPCSTSDVWVPTVVRHIALSSIASISLRSCPGISE